MTQQLILVWSSRIAGFAVSLFLGLFALDAFAPGKALSDAWLDFALHLVPALMVLTIVALSWQRPLIGALAFIFLAVAYAVTARAHVDWILAISGPLLGVGLLFLWRWRSSPAGT
jgi:hypothetical protein